MRLEHALPNTEQWERLHLGRITPTYVNVVMSSGEQHARFQRAIAADLRGDEREPLRGFEYVEASHAEKHRLLLESETVSPGYFKPGYFCIHREHDWLGSSPQGLVMLGSSVTAGVSVRTYRSLYRFKRAASMGVCESPRHYNKVQAHMLVTDTPLWYVLHVWQDVERGLKQEAMTTEVRDTNRVREIYAACIRFMHETAQLVLRESA